jgi:hypothetical protein
MKSAIDRSHILPEEYMEPEWAAWMHMRPAERWKASRGLLRHYLEIGGSLDPDPDLQSPFWSREDCEAFARGALAGLPLPRQAR